MLLLLHVSLLSWSGLCHIPNLGKHKPISQYHYASAFYCKYSTVMKISDTKNQRYSVFHYVPDIIISWTYACRFSYTCICLLLNFCICVCVCLCICARCGGEGSPPPSYKWYHESSNLSLDLGEREATSSRFGDRLSPYDDEDDEDDDEEDEGSHRSWRPFLFHSREQKQKSKIIFQ